MDIVRVYSLVAQPSYLGQAGHWLDDNGDPDFTEEILDPITVEDSLFVARNGHASEFLPGILGTNSQHI